MTQIPDVLNEILAEVTLTVDRYSDSSETPFHVRKEKNYVLLLRGQSCLDQAKSYTSAPEAATLVNTFYRHFCVMTIITTIEIQTQLD